MSEQPASKSPQQPSRWRLIAWFVLVLLSLVGLYLAVGPTLLHTVRSSDPYEVGVARAKQHPELITRIGSPIEAGEDLHTYLRWRRTGPWLKASVPLLGPTGTATLQVEASLRDDVWRYRRMRVVNEDGESIDLLLTGDPRSGQRQEP